MTTKSNHQNNSGALNAFSSDDAEDHSAKTVLAFKLNELINKRGLSQIEAAKITGMTQPKVSQISRYKLQNISLERLMQALVSLNQNIKIVVRPAHCHHTAGITVAAEVV